MRIDKYLSHALGLTRSQVKSLITKKVVYVDQILINSPSVHIDESQTIRVNGNVVTYQEFYYILLNKPKGYISATSDNFHKTVLDLLEKYKPYNIAPVGRLDIDTTGALLLTNNGKLAHFLISPKWHVEKEYEVIVNHPLTEDLVLKFQQGIILEDNYKCLPAKLKITDTYQASLILTEGKFHQVKRMFKTFGYEVLELNRCRFDTLNCEGLSSGEFRHLTKDEIIYLLNKIH